MAVYFATVGRRVVKIGSSTDPAQRVRDLQVANSEEVKLIGEIEGGREVERALHRTLVDERVRGEWYLQSETTMALIAALLNQPLLAGLIYELCQPKVTGPARRTPKQTRNISPETREKLSRIAKERHARGELGGREFGKMGGRPRSNVA